MIQGDYAGEALDKVRAITRLPGPGSALAANLANQQELKQQLLISQELNRLLIAAGVTVPSASAAPVSTPMAPPIVINPQSPTLTPAGPSTAPPSPVATYAQTIVNQSQSPYQSYFDKYGIDESTFANAAYSKRELEVFVSLMRADIENGSAYPVTGRRRGMIPKSDKTVKAIQDNIIQFFDVQIQQTFRASSSAQPVVHAVDPDDEEEENLLAAQRLGSGLHKWHPIPSKKPNTNLYLNVPKMGQGVLSISRKTKNGRHVKLDQFKNRPINRPFQEVLKQLLRTRRLHDTADMKPEDCEYLYQILSIAEPNDLTDRQRERVRKKEAELQAKLRQRQKSTAETQWSRLQLLIGSAQIGNNNNAPMIKEGTKLISSLVRSGVLTIEEADKLRPMLK